MEDIEIEIDEMFVQIQDMYDNGRNMSTIAQVVKNKMESVSFAVRGWEAGDKKKISAYLERNIINIGSKAKAEKVAKKIIEFSDITIDIKLISDSLKTIVIKMESLQNEIKNILNEESGVDVLKDIDMDKIVKNAENYKKLEMYESILLYLKGIKRHEPSVYEKLVVTLMKVNKKKSTAEEIISSQVEVLLRAVNSRSITTKFEAEKNTKKGGRVFNRVVSSGPDIIQFFKDEVSGEIEYYYSAVTNSMDIHFELDQILRHTLGTALLKQHVDSLNVGTKKPDFLIKMMRIAMVDGFKVKYNNGVEYKVKLNDSRLIRELILKYRDEINLDGVHPHMLATNDGINVASLKKNDLNMVPDEVMAVSMKIFAIGQMGTVFKENRKENGGAIDRVEAGVMADFIGRIAEKMSVKLVSKEGVKYYELAGSQLENKLLDAIEKGGLAIAINSDSTKESFGYYVLVKKFEALRGNLKADEVFLNKAISLMIVKKATPSEYTIIDLQDKNDELKDKNDELKDKNDELKIQRQNDIHVENISQIFIEKGKSFWKEVVSKDILIEPTLAFIKRGAHLVRERKTNRGHKGIEIFNEKAFLILCISQVLFNNEENEATPQILERWKEAPIFLMEVLKEIEIAKSEGIITNKKYKEIRNNLITKPVSEKTKKEIISGLVKK